MTLKKRLLALCMAVVMVFSLCSISAFAAAPTDDKQPVVRCTSKRVLGTWHGYAGRNC